MYIEQLTRKVRALEHGGLAPQRGGGPPGMPGPV